MLRKAAMAHTPRATTYDVHRCPQCGHETPAGFPRSRELSVKHLARKHGANPVRALPSATVTVTDPTDGV